MTEQESIWMSLSKISSPSTDMQCVAIHVIIFILSKKGPGYSNTAKNVMNFERITLKVERRSWKALRDVSYYVKAQLLFLLLY